MEGTIQIVFFFEVQGDTKIAADISLGWFHHILKGTSLLHFYRSLILWLVSRMCGLDLLNDSTKEHFLIWRKGKSDAHGNLKQGEA